MRIAVHPDIDDMRNKKNLRRLRRATHYRRDWEVREAASDALGELGDPRAVDSLLDALSDEYWPVRKAAASSLGEIGDPGAVEPLIAALRAELTHRAGAAVPVRFGYTDFPGLHDSWTARRAIVVALGRLGDARGALPLVEALRDDHKWVRVDAAEALGKLGDARAVDALIGVLTDSDSLVRATAAAALDRLAWRPDDGAAGAAYWIATQQWAKCGETGAIAPLISALGDEDPAIRGGAARTLADVGTRAVPPLIDALQDPHMTLRGRSGAAEALGGIGDARAVEALLPLLDDREISVRRAAAQALGRLGDTRAAEPLVSALADHDADMRTAAAEALQQLAWRPEGTAAGAAYWVATHQWDEAVRAAAVEPLIMALQDPDASVRKPAAEALGKLGDARAIAPLSGALGDSDIRVARAAARALVAMYSSGKLDEAQRARVLALRERITFQDDVPEHEGVDVRDDRSIGVDFPI
jgi:HEAT repeat protein